MPMSRSTRCLLLACLYVLGGMAALFAPWHAGFAAAESARGNHSAPGTPFYLDGDDIVYVSKSGECYHEKPNCYPIKTAYDLTAREAVRLGYRACKKCKPTPPLYEPDQSAFPEGEAPVYLIILDDFYHADETCAGICDSNGAHWPVAVTVGEAEHLQKQPCPLCCPQ